MTRYWFKPKRFGYGFHPISKEGWFATLVFISILLLSVYVNDISDPSVSIKQGIRFLLDLIIISTVASILFAKKTEGTLKWHWG